LSGNQAGILFTHYMLMRKKDRLSPADTLVTSIVTGTVGPRIAADFGIKNVRTLTGFRYIAGAAEGFDPAENRFFMGYEESIGYLLGNHAGDKDAVSAAVIACEMAAYYKRHGKTLYDALYELYEKYGYSADLGKSFVFAGTGGAKEMADVMDRLRSLGKNLDESISYVEDYIGGYGGNPPSNVLKFIFKDESWLAVRPSGTEPKLKFYFYSLSDEKAQSQEKTAAMKAAAQALIDTVA